MSFSLPLFSHSLTHCEREEEEEEEGKEEAAAAATKVARASGMRLSYRTVVLCSAALSSCWL